MSRRPRPRRSTQKRSWLPWVGAGLIVLLVLGGLGAAAVATSRATRIDASTLCATTGPSAVTVVLIDATDSISSVQRTAIINRLNKIDRQLKANERLAVFEISPGANPLTPAFSMCRPAAAAETSALTGNKKLASQKYDGTFKPAVAATLSSLLNKAPAAGSPIMEAIQAASVSTFQASDLPDEAPRRLVVVSDMLEHGPAGSQYGSLPDFDDYKASPQFARATSDLTDVDVIVLYLRRDDGASVQGINHIDFWARWFAAQGASDFKAIPVEG